MKRAVLALTASLSTLYGLAATNALIFDDDTPELAVFGTTAGGLFALAMLHRGLARDDERLASPGDWRLGLGPRAVALGRGF